MHNMQDIIFVFMVAINFNYYSFKVFPRFWLVETTRIIHHNQLLFAKFGKKKLRHIESVTSKVQPAAIIEPLTKKNWGRDCVIFVEQKNKARKWLRVGLEV